MSIFVDSGSCKYWLASGSNEPTIHVHDLGSMLGTCAFSYQWNSSLSLRSSFSVVYLLLLCWRVLMPSLVLPPTGDSSSSSSRSAPVTECFRQLAGHSGRVTDLSWSPHQFELLLSSSYDGTAEVRQTSFTLLTLSRTKLMLLIWGDIYLLIWKILVECVYWSSRN